MGIRFRNAPVYVGTRKIAEIESGTYEHTSGDEMQIGDGAYLGHSDGVETVKVTFNTVCPVKGHEKDLKGIILRKEYVQVGLQIDGGFEQFEGRLVGRNYAFDSKAGSCKGTFNFEGGRPDVT